MSPAPSAEEALAFYYHGFRAALERYRALTVGGWCLAALGAGVALASCGQGATPDLMSFLVPVGASAAGVALVYQSVAALDAYVRISFPFPDPGAAPGHIAAVCEESAQLMRDIDQGGWQEAYAALRALKTMPERHGLERM
jgi:hypothetical protein